MLCGASHPTPVSRLLDVTPPRLGPYSSSRGCILAVWMIDGLDDLGNRETNKAINHTDVLLSDHCDVCCQLRVSRFQTDAAQATVGADTGSKPQAESGNAGCSLSP